MSNNFQDSIDTDLEYENDNILSRSLVSDQDRVTILKRHSESEDVHS